MTARTALAARVVVGAVVVAGSLVPPGATGRAVAAAGPAPAVISTWAGGVGEGPGTDLSVHPVDLAVHGTSVYFADPQHEAVRALDTRTGDVRTVAGNGDPSPQAAQQPRGDNGPATATRIADARGVAVDAGGRVYVGDYGDGTIRRVDADGVISTLTQLHAEALETDPHGNLLVRTASTVLRVTPTGTATTLYGRPCPCADGDLDGTPAVAAASPPRGVAVDAGGRLYVSVGVRVYLVDDGGVLRRVAGGGSPADGVGDGGPARSAQLVEPGALAFDPPGNLLIADGYTGRIRRVNPAGTISTLAGGGAPGDGLGDGGPATGASLSQPSGMVVGPDGALYLSDTGHLRLRKVTAGVITTVAGNGKEYSGGDGGPAAKAQLYDPAGLARDPAGNTYVADYLGNRVRKIDPSGRISAFVGTGEPSFFAPSLPTFSGDGGPAVSARILGPAALAADASGNVFVVDQGNYRVRKVDPAGVITTVAGGGTDSLGDGGPATAVHLPRLVAITVDAAGNLYVAEATSRRIRKITPDGRIGTVAGGGTLAGAAGDGAPATSAALDLTQGTALAVDPLGQLYVSEIAIGRVRRVDLAGVMTTVVGGGSPDLFPHNLGQEATSVRVRDVGALAFDANGDLYLAMTYDKAIVRLDPTGRLHKVAGAPPRMETPLGDGGPALDARLDLVHGNRSSGMALDGAGNLYVADTGNHRVRRIDGVFSSRRVRATGWNGFGQLGDGSTTDRLTAAPVGVESARAVAAGYYHSLAVTADGTVWAWGLNAWGQLGDGTTVDRRVPTKVSGLAGVVAVAAGAYHSLALRADGTVWAWGWNGTGQLGDGTTTDRHTAVQVVGLRGVSALAGGGFHNLALTRDGAVWSWGWNHYGQLGTGSASELEVRATRVPALSGASGVAAGALHSLATAGDGAVHAWGWNGVGQLGDGTTIDRRWPVRLNHAGQVRAGGYHSFTEGHAWGWNAYGQLGIAGGAEMVTTPTLTIESRDPSMVGAGVAHNAAVGLDGTVETWGWNAYGALGDGTATNRSGPVAVTDLKAVLAASGALHTLIVG